MRDTSPGCLSKTPNCGTWPQPRHVPRLGMEPVSPQFAGQYSIHLTTPARAILVVILMWLYREANHVCLCCILTRRIFVQFQWFEHSPNALQKSITNQFLCEIYTDAQYFTKSLTFSVLGVYYLPLIYSQVKMRINYFNLAIFGSLRIRVLFMLLGFISPFHTTLILCMSTHTR